MKFSSSATLLALAASSVTAQGEQQTGPFHIKISGSSEDSSIDGYAFACHAGAAIEGFCYSAGALPSDASTAYDFFFNTTANSQVDGFDYGTLVWKLPFVNPNGTTSVVGQALSADYQLGSNVVAPMFGFSSTPGVNQFPVGFDDAGKLFGVAYYDDSKNQPQEPRPTYDPRRVYGWQKCWQGLGSYYYDSVGYALTLPPSNPTCQGIEITLEQI